MNLMNNLNPVVPIIGTQNVQVITGFRINIRNVVLNTKAVINVECLNSSNNVIDTKTLIMTGNDYANWGSSDNYVVNWVAQQLNFRLANSSISGNVNTISGNVPRSLP